ncbi:MAG: hypothetical protein HZB80_11790 [Deltaproteobacteria bacterium]|nr:hypothetical protein [Deltaproteobacteria bacterium]
MAKKIVISFEGDNVKVVYASARGSGSVVKKTLTLTNDEFDGFLQRDKNKEFIVVYDFKTFFSDLLHLPPLKEKHLKGIIESEIRKGFREAKGFSFIYTVIGDKTLEGKKKREIFVFAADNREIENILNRFASYGKAVTHLIPRVFSLAKIVPFSEEPVFCVSITGIDKTLFLLKDGNILFIRIVHGIENGINDFDIQNINMTINHCRQSLKINPLQVLLIGSACSEYNAGMAVILPLVCVDYKPRVFAEKEAIMEFISVIPCILKGKASRELLEHSNILPVKYKSILNLRTILSYSVAMFLILSVIGLLYIIVKIPDVRIAKRRIEVLRAEIKSIETAGSIFAGKKAELEKFMPVIKIANEINSAPEIQKALLVISSLDFTNISINNIDMKTDTDGIKLSVKGKIDAKNLSDIQMRRQSLIDSMKKAEGMEVLSDKLDMKEKTFEAEAVYKK